MLGMIVMMIGTIVATIVVSQLTIGWSRRLPIRFRRSRSVESEAHDAVHEYPRDGDRATLRYGDRETLRYGAGPINSPA